MSDFQDLPDPVESVVFDAVKGGRPSSVIQFPVIAVGASAGGLPSLERLLENVPEKLGVAFVIVQHLSPDFRSAMDEILGRCTPMQIRQAQDGHEIEIDTIYLIPPRKEAILSGGRFRLYDREPKETLTLPIDRFFHSLAQDAPRKFVAVVLSGSGSDGSRGIRDVHIGGGLVIAESPESAQFNGMPRSAIATELVDEILHAEQMLSVIQGFFAGRRQQRNASAVLRGTPEGESPEGNALVFNLLQRRYGVDFSDYKQTTVSRRIKRRVRLKRLNSVEEYARQLAVDEDEISLLYQDLLIGDTTFFRDLEAFRVLGATAIGDIVQNASPEEDVRVWVAGCATGEEAYSIAILFHEAFERAGKLVRLKIFATDPHEESLDDASTGEFGRERFSSVTKERLERFFDPVADGYRVKDMLRRFIVFANHNMMLDAPFTKLNLVICRNLLIYLQSEPQRKAISLFHYALLANGVLMLGPSESTGDLFEEFETIDERWRIFRKRRDVRLSASTSFPVRSDSEPSLQTARRGNFSTSAELVSASGNDPDGIDPGILDAYDWLLSRHMPPAILIDDHHEVLHVFGGAEVFMHVRGGRPTSDAIAAFDKEVALALDSAVEQVKSSRESVVYSGFTFEVDQAQEPFDIRVDAVHSERAKRPQFLISFCRVPQSGSGHAVGGEPYSVGDGRMHHDRQAESHQSELCRVRAALPVTSERREAYNEPLQSSSEALVKANEELQNTNEKLNAANRELCNENAHFKRETQDLVELTADLERLLERSDIATVALGRDLRIQRFTPSFARIFMLQPQDVGRPLNIFSNCLQFDNLLDSIREVLRSGDPFEGEAKDRDGVWLLIRILPCPVGDQVEGVVITLVSIHRLKLYQATMEAAVNDRERFLAMVSHEMRNPISAVLSASHLLKSDHASEKTIQGAVSVIRRQSHHVARLLDDLLDVSRMTQNKLELRKRDMDLRDVISHAVDSIRPMVDHHSQSLHVDVEDVPLTITGDPDRLQQVMENLIGNAVKYSPAGTKMGITAKISRGEVEVQVWDEGVGIDPERIDDIFEPFRQLSQSRDQREGGMGVGLSLVRFIVQGHGGSIAASSEGAGKGSQFSVRLPLVISPETYRTEGDLASSFRDRTLDERLAAGRPRAIEFRPPRRPIRSIVVIEDEDDNRQMLQALLEIEGFLIRTAGTGSEGVAKVEESASDAVLIDVGLPDRDGYSVADELRSKFGDSLYLVAFTGHGQLHDVRRALEAGFDQHLVKPLDLDRLLAILTHSAGQ